MRTDREITGRGERHKPGSVCVVLFLGVCVMGEREIKEVMCWPAVQRTDSNITQSKSKTLHQHKSQGSRRRQEKKKKNKNKIILYICCLQPQPCKSIRTK